MIPDCIDPGSLANPDAVVSDYNVPDYIELDSLTNPGFVVSDCNVPDWGQCGVAVSGRVEVMALTAILGFKEGCTILSYDGANAFNSMYRNRFLPTLAEIVPSVVP